MEWLEVTEMADMISSLVGKSAAKFYESAGYSVRTWRSGTNGVVSHGGDEYLVVRHGLRKWEVRCEARTWWFSSQWELLAWFGDRL